MKTTIYLLRHGEYANPKAIAPYRLPGFHLSQKGIADVTRVAQTLALEPIVAVFTSPLERTVESAAILARPHELTPFVDDRLIETRSPAQGKPQGFADSMGGWDMYETDWYREQGGELFQDIFARVCACFEEKVAQYDGQAIMLVTHGDPIMLLLAHFTHVPFISNQLEKIPFVPMAGGYRIEIEAAGKTTVSPIKIL